MRFIYDNLSKKFDLSQFENIYRGLKYLYTPLNYNKAKNPTISKEIVQNYNKSRHSGAHTLICKAPFNSLNFDSYGVVTVCAFNRTLQIGNVQEMSLNEIWNGKNINDLREKIKNYDFSKGCIACQNQLVKKDFQHFGGRNADISTIKVDYPTHLSFELTNICNLECIMCSGRFSNLIRKNRERLPAIKMAYDDSFFNQLKPFLEHAEFVDFFGGEPTMTKMNYEIWEYLILKNPSCKIQVTTNAAEIPERFYPILKKGKMSIIVSLDAFEKEVYESIRLNAVYEKTYENIRFYHSLFKEDKINMQLSICPMIGNWREMPKLVRFANQLGVRVCFNQVVDPKNLSIKYLSNEEIIIIVNELKNEVFEDGSISFNYNANMYNSFILRLEGWAKDALIRNNYIKEKLKYTYNELKQETYNLFLSNMNEKDNTKFFLVEIFNEIELKYPQSKLILNILNLYEIKDQESLNFEFQNIEKVKEMIHTHIENISKIEFQILSQII